MSSMAPQAAEFWHNLNTETVQCELCPHQCVIADGKCGICRVRCCDNGRLVALGFGHLSSIGMDPIEKKPLYHFHPGSSVLSVGGWGCNFRCSFCQNWSISQQFRQGGEPCTSQQLVKSACENGSVGIAYTYNEPLIAFEFVEQTARAARDKGMSNILVTNGYICAEPSVRLLKLIDAANIDIKSMDEEFYKQECGGELAPVLAFCMQARKSGCHVEITNLLIPGHNDEEGQIRQLARWIGEHLGRATPLHLSAYSPRYKLQAESTSVSALSRARAICSESLEYVYLGNVATSEGQNTECPQCGSVLVRRRGYHTEITGLTNGRCGKCGRRSDVVQ